MQSHWTFVSNHALVLTTLRENPHARQRDIADVVGITQGAVQRILHDLVDAGYVEVERVGRGIRYLLQADKPLRHERLHDVLIGDLLSTLHPEGEASSKRGEYAA